jgi:hypothetical protein
MFDEFSIVTEFLNVAKPDMSIPKRSTLDVESNTVPLLAAIVTSFAVLLRVREDKEPVGASMATPPLRNESHLAVPATSSAYPGTLNTPRPTPSRYMSLRLLELPKIRFSDMMVRLRLFGANWSRFDRTGDAYVLVSATACDALRTYGSMDIIARSMLARFVVSEGSALYV